MFSGLGDRHAENIMFDMKTGETVHVDFDCLFEKGETFEWPEKVPFRLTHNMVHAFGVTGIEGMFRFVSHLHNHFYILYLTLPHVYTSTLSYCTCKLPLYLTARVHFHSTQLHVYTSTIL